MTRAEVRERYTRRLDALIRKAERLDDSAVRRLFGLLDEARKEVSRAILNSDWKQAQAAQLTSRIEREIEAIGRDLGESIRAYQDARWGDAASATDELLSLFPGEQKKLAIPLDRGQLVVLQDFSADLITRVPRETIDRVSTAVRLGIVAEKSPHDVVKELGRSLVDRHGNPAPGVWGDTLTRAEVVYRTEVNRAYSLATEVRMGQHEEVRPGLKKTWLHSGRGATARPSHVRAGRDYRLGGDPGPIPIGDMFVLHVGVNESSRGMPAGEYPCMYPRDPRLPAGASVSCGCTHAPWRDAWAEAA